MGKTRAYVIDFADEQLKHMEAAPSEGEHILCPACHDRHPLRYETDQDRLLKHLGFVECRGKNLLAVFKGKIIGKIRPRHTPTYWAW